REPGQTPIGPRLAMEKDTNGRAMRASEMANEALARATEGQTMANWPAIFAGFLAKGIAEADIRPRENVLTFHAWRALGRHVRRGEHGVRVQTWIPLPDKIAADGTVERNGGKRPKSAVVFHVSQTDPNEPVRSDDSPAIHYPELGE